jgi:hypothetical protein
MEKIFLNKRIVVIAFFTVFSTGVMPVRAHESDPVPVELKFIRWVKEQPIFQFDFSGNVQNDEFTITLRDEFNNILYNENIKGEFFTKSFLLNTDEVADHTLYFEIRSKKLNRSKVYPVNRHTFAQQETA